ncbi:aldo/keto reductase [Bradyrhizobium guangzhouense]|uniref:NADP-dependent oxidoreductase domain-containing protein n=1 Tax=Bradyrhizobium guangzhouense TaxID=1325095 RepID=A0AAE6CAN9_9BRAD|nr:aldo/keto reductase [Bradyrhizobium guangzhouense]QAU48745.1 hypothetical protein XH91_27600 [Bradyrhizobium guangzhouense]
MRTVHFSPLARDVSALGFGCASLGSRVAPSVGLQSLQYAYECGVTWYDVAPPYGDGQAEQLLGTFLRGRRDRVVVCTKVGIERPDISRTKRWLRPAARLLVKRFPKLRATVAKSRSSGERKPLDPNVIRKSVETSLRLLRSDYIDVLALHEPTPADCTSPEVLETLQNLVKAGLVRTLSIAGSLDAIKAGTSSSSIFTTAQFADNKTLKTCETLRQEHPPASSLFFVTHSVFGTSIPMDPPSALLSYAFRSNEKGVVITSMTSRDHISSNCKAASVKLEPFASKDRAGRGFYVAGNEKPKI